MIRRSKAESPSSDSAPSARASDGSWPLRILRPFLRVPLFYKLLFGNLVVALATGATAAWLPDYLARHEDFSTPLVWATLGVVLLAGLLFVNGLIVRLALSPVLDLERTARSVAAGDPARRVPPSLLADTDLERLTRSFNEMLDRSESYRTRLKDLAARALAAQEAERKRIASELHDDTAQRLAALLLQLEVMRRRAPRQGPSEKLEGVRSELANTLEDLRRFARGLRPPALDDLGLISAIDAHLREVEEHTAFDVHFDRPPGELELDPKIELVAYRIVQEAVGNAVRHSGASTIHVGISVASPAPSGTPGRVELTVRDDGHGFDPDEALERRKEAMGIFGMKERAQYVGGSVEVRSEVGEGTEIRVVLPGSAHRGVPPS